MKNKDLITMTKEDGTQEQVELVLTVDKNNKHYILYKDKENNLFASYYLEDDTLHNDLTDEEYDMLESIYRKGVDIYDK